MGTAVTNGRWVSVAVPVTTGATDVSATEIVAVPATFEAVIWTP